jgi:hypothetical protein
MKLTSIAAGDSLTGAVLAETLKYSPLLANYVEFFTGFGDSTRQRKVQYGVEDMQFRSLDMPYVEKIQKPEYVNFNRKIIGFEAGMDVARERMGYDIASEMASQLKRRGVDIARTFDKALINGDSEANPEQFDGLAKIVKNNPDQVVTAGDNGLRIQMGFSDAVKKSHQHFLEKIDETVLKCIGVNKVIIAGEPVIARLNTIAREYIQWVSVGEFGTKIAYYNGIPIVNIEANGDKIIARDEVIGSATNCSSLYVASFEEAAGLSYFSVNEGFMVYPIKQVKNAYTTTVEMILDTALYNDRAVSKLEGLVIDSNV